LTATRLSPADGRIERDPKTGEPTGTLHEGAAYSYQDRYLPQPSRKDWEHATLKAQTHLHSLGITGWQDAWGPATLESYLSLAGSGQLTARVVGALWWDLHRELDQVSEFLGQRESGAAQAAQTAGLRAAGFHRTSIKIMTDGVMENYTGALLEPYCDGCGSHTDNYRLSYLEPDLLAAAVTELDRHGFQVHMHAIGDRAVRNALDAVRAARNAVTVPSANRRSSWETSAATSCGPRRQSKTHSTRCSVGCTARARRLRIQGRRRAAASGGAGFRVVGPCFHRSCERPSLPNKVIRWWSSAASPSATTRESLRNSASVVDDSGLRCRPRQGAPVGRRRLTVRGR